MDGFSDESILKNFADGNIPTSVS